MMSEMEIDDYQNKFWLNENGELHRINGPALEWSHGMLEWWVNGNWLGYDNKGFWELWDRLTPEQKQDPVLLSYLPGDFNV